MHPGIEGRLQHREQVMISQLHTRCLHCSVIRAFYARGGRINVPSCLMQPMCQRFFVLTFSEM